MPTNIPIEPFYSNAGDLGEYRGDKPHYFAVALQEILGRGAIVGACVNTGRNMPLSDSVTYGVRPDGDQNIVVDARGIWTVEAWLEEAGANRMAPLTAEAFAQAMNDEPGSVGYPKADAHGFDASQRAEIEAAKDVIRRNGLTRVLDETLEANGGTPTPA